MEKTKTLTEFWVIYHHDSGKTLRKNPENYYSRMSPIGPAFGATFETTPKFATRADTTDVTRYFSALVMDELQHVFVVAPEDTTFKPWVKAWRETKIGSRPGDAEIIAKSDRVAKELGAHWSRTPMPISISDAVDKTVANIRAMPLGDYIMGGPEGPQSPENEAMSKRFYDHIAKFVGRRPHETEEKEDGERSEVREQEPGRGVQLDPRGQEPQEVEAPRGTGGEAGGSDRSEVQREEAVPSAEGGRERVDGLAFWKDHLVIAHVGDPKPAHTMGDSVTDVEDRRFLAELDKLIGQPVHGTALGESSSRFLPNANVTTEATVKKTEEELRSFSYDVVSGMQSQAAKEVGTEANKLDNWLVDVAAMTTPEPEHTQDPEGEWPRCGGDTICDQCGKTFYKHPLDGPDGYQGKFLNRICDGRLVKL